MNAPHGSIKYIMKASLQQNIFLIRTKHDSFFYIYSLKFSFLSLAVFNSDVYVHTREKKNGGQCCDHSIYKKANKTDEARKR